MFSLGFLGKFFLANFFRSKQKPIATCTGDGLFCTGFTKFSGQQHSRASVGTRTTAATTLATHLAGQTHLLLVMVETLERAVNVT
jgi:hypothetical protein